MKKIIQIYFLLNIAFDCIGQDISIDSRYISFDSLKFISDKQSIINRLGKPQEIYEPKYECGFLSESEQGIKYYQLIYKDIVFTGNNYEKYLIEIIKFNDTTNYKLEYSSMTFSCETTVKDFIKFFGSAVNQRKHVEGDEIIFALFIKNADDALNFYFRNNRLIMIEYWSPC